MTGGSRPPDPEAEGRSRRRRRWWSLLSVLLLALALGWLGARSVAHARAGAASLRAGREALLAAERSLLGDDAEAALRWLRRAEGSFREARRQGEHPSVRLVGWVPYLGRPADAVRGVADIGIRVAGAGRRVAAALDRLDGGLSALLPRDGRLPLDALRELSPALAQATSELEAARAAADRLPGPSLLAPTGAVRDQVRRELGRALRVVRPTAVLVRALPAIAAGGTTRRYFVGAQTPAELRGTGGFIGAYSILSVRDGRMALAPFRSLEDLPDLPVSRAPAPTPELREIYDRFGGAGYWRNINMSPDVPTAAAWIEALYRRVRGVPLDGTILVDLHALAALLEATGPVRVEALGTTLRSDNVVPFLANRLYVAVPDPPARRRVLAATAREVLDRLLSGPPPAPTLRALARAASEGHLLLHAADPGVQAAFRRLGVAGDLGAPVGDFLGVFVSNAAGNKVDFYLSRHLRYRVSLRGDGTGSARAEVRLTNHAPAGARPGEALGPYPGTGLGPGDNRSFVSVYCARGCGLVGATEDGRPRGMESHREGGHPLFARYVRIDAQRSVTLGLTFLLPRAWTPEGSGGTYRLRLQAQATVRPAPVTLVVDLPPGGRVTSANVPLEVTGGRATWRGTVGRQVDVVVRFEGGGR